MVILQVKIYSDTQGSGIILNFLKKFKLINSKTIADRARARARARIQLILCTIAFSITVSRV